METGTKVGNGTDDKKPTDSYYHTLDPKYPLSPYTLPQLYDIAAERNNGKGLTWCSPEVTVTHTEMVIQARLYAKGLLALGVTRGHLLMSFGVTGPEATIMFMACSTIGVKFMHPYLFSPIVKSSDEKLELMKPDVLVIGDVLLGNLDEYTYGTVSETLRNRRKLGAAVHQVLHIYRDYSITQPNDDCPSEPLSKLIALGESVSDEQLSEAKSKVTLREPCMYVSSSGTTGKPKIMLLSAACFTNGAARKISRYGITEDTCMAEVNINMIDLAHIEEVTGSLAIGYKLVIFNHIIEDYELAWRLQLQIIEKHRPEFVHMDQYMTQLIVSRDEHINGFDLSSVKSFLIATACTTTQFKKELMDQYPLSFDCYGPQEFFYVSSSKPGENCYKPNSVGKPYPNIEIKLVDEQMNTVPVGTPGHILARGYCCFLEYHQQPELYAEVVDKDGWVKTGDLGVMDEDFDLQILGRVEGYERFKFYGDIVYAAPIENLMSEHEAVTQGIVAGLPRSGANGHELVYCIILKSGYNPTIQELTRDFISKVENNTQWPWRIMFFDKFPRHGTRNKISRGKILEEVQRRVALDADAGWTDLNLKGYH